MYLNIPLLMDGHSHALFRCCCCCWLFYLCVLVSLTYGLHCPVLIITNTMEVKMNLSQTRGPWGQGTWVLSRSLASGEWVLMLSVTSACLGVRPAGLRGSQPASSLWLTLPRTQRAGAGKTNPLRQPCGLSTGSLYPWLSTFLHEEDLLTEEFSVPRGL